MSRSVRKQAPPPSHSGSGNLITNISVVISQVHALAHRLGPTQASIFMLATLALVSIYFMRDSMLGVVVVYSIAVVATVFAHWKKL